MPPRSTAGTIPQPSNSPAMKPGGKQRARSIRPGWRHRAQVPHELFGGVLQPEHEEEQDHPDLGAYLDELLRGDQRDDASLSDDQPGDQIEGDR